MFDFLTRKKTSDGINQNNNPAATLTGGLKLTSKLLVDGIKNIFSRRTKIDQDLLQELEEQLLISDIGVKVTQEILSHLQLGIKNEKAVDANLAIKIIKEELVAILAPCAKPLVLPAGVKPAVILLVGVNGAGKTTTIGKLAKRLQDDGCKVLLAAGDTFRAAAIEQLKIWGERNSMSVVAQQPGADSAAVIYDAFQSAKAKFFDVLIADTAGRLHTHSGLMDELKKIKRTLQKLDSSAPHEVLLVLDATIGQNALNQVKQFNEIIGVTGLVITKLDGTAKGGAIFAIAKETGIPIRFIGVGEDIVDLRVFDGQKFVDALFGDRIC